MNKRILVIEDEIDTACIIKDSFISRGYDVIVASSGMEGVTRAKQKKPDLITLDIMMPGTSGIDVLKKLKTDNNISDIPIIIITGVDFSYRKECIDLGVKDFMQKPLDFKKLYQKFK